LVNKPPKKHEPNESAGITPEIAAALDRAASAMESGDPDGIVEWDESSETWSNQHPSDIGTSSHSLHRVSSNEQVAFASLVERIKNENPELEHEQAYDAAVDRFNAMQDDADKEKK
jgi:hypothetical protein